MGFRSSTWSQMTLMDIIIGTASSMPQTPHAQLQNRRPTKTATRFIDATLPISERRQKPAFERGDDERDAGDGEHHGHGAELEKCHERQSTADDERAVVRESN